MFNTTNKKNLGVALNNVKSKSKFLASLNSDTEHSLNCTWDSYKATPGKINFKQTKLCLRKSLKRSSQQHLEINGTDKPQEATTEFFIMPLPNNKYVTRNAVWNRAGDSSANTIKIKKPRLLEEQPKRENYLNKPGRKLLAMIGNVKFVQNATNIYKNVNVMWVVLGKLVKVVEGNIRFENTILLNNIYGVGPVLQCTYFDMKNVLSTIEKGCCLRVVGCLTSKNKLKIFKIKSLNTPIDDNSISRIQNVNSFILLQNENRQ